MAFAVREMILGELAPVMDLHLEGLDKELVLLNQIFPGKSVNYEGRDTLAKLLTQIIQSREGQVFVALSGTDYAGYCLVTKKVYPVEFPKFCGCINGIYIRENFRRHKLGSRLFQSAVDWLRAEGVTYLELYHMINDERAAAFWRYVGFTPIQFNCAMKI